MRTIREIAYGLRRNGSETTTLEVMDHDLILSALCAHRDNITMNYDIEDEAVQTRLSEINDEIHNVAQQIFALNH